MNDLLTVIIILAAVILGYILHEIPERPDNRGEVNSKWLKLLYDIDMDPEEAKYMQLTFPHQDITFDFAGMTVIGEVR